jgi:cell division protein FtsL
MSWLLFSQIGLLVILLTVCIVATVNVIHQARAMEYHAKQMADKERHG